MRARRSKPDFESDDKSPIGWKMFSLEPKLLRRNMTWLMSGQSIYNNHLKRKLAYFHISLRVFK